MRAVRQQQRRPRQAARRCNVSQLHGCRRGSIISPLCWLAHAALQLHDALEALGSNTASRFCTISYSQIRLHAPGSQGTPGGGPKGRFVALCSCILATMESHEAQWQLPGDPRQPFYRRCNAVWAEQSRRACQPYLCMVSCCCRWWLGQRTDAAAATARAEPPLPVPS